MEYLNGLSVEALALGVVALVLFVVLVMVWVKAWHGSTSLTMTGPTPNPSKEGSL